MRPRVDTVAKVSLLASPEIHDVDVCAQPGVIRKVPTVMVRIVVDHDLVAIPEPAVAEAIIERGDLKVEAVEPEALSASSSEPEDMPAADASREASMLPGTVEVIPGIVAAGIVPDPAVVGMDVRNIRMPGLIAKIARRAALRGATTWTSRSRGRAMCGNVPTAHMTPATLPATGFPLGQSRNRKDQQQSKKPGKRFHVGLPLLPFP
jgi:hypothetical protein